MRSFVIYKKEGELIDLRWLSLIIIFATPLITLGSLGIKVQWVAITATALIGVGAVLQKDIEKRFISPLLSYSIEKTETTTNNGVKQNWYNLLLRNKTYLTAKNVRVKIKDEKQKGWINLTQPFALLREMRYHQDPTTIKTITSKEEAIFNIGFTEPNRLDGFKVRTDISPNNVDLAIPPGDEYRYFLEIVGDNMIPIKLEMSINNPKNKKFSTKDITIKKL